MGELAVSGGDWMAVPRDEREARLVRHYEALRIANPLRLARANVDNPLACLCGDASPLMDALMGGESVPELAARVGVSSRAVYAWLMEHAPGEWTKFSAAAAVERLERADEKLDSAVDNIEVSRLGQISRNAQWQLERMAPRLYAAKQQGAGVSIVVNIDPSCGGSVEVGGVVLDQRGDSGAEASAQLSGG